MKCSVCNGTGEIVSNQYDKISPINIRHIHNGEILSDTVKIYDDGFYEIVKGIRKGNLVHRWNIVK